MGMTRPHSISAIVFLFFTPLSSHMCVRECVCLCGGLRGQTPNAHSTLVIQPLGHLVLHLWPFPQQWKEGLIFCSAKRREKWASHFSNFNLPTFATKKNYRALCWPVNLPITSHWVAGEESPCRSVCVCAQHTLLPRRQVYHLKQHTQSSDKAD